LGRIETRAVPRSPAHRHTGNPAPPERNLARRTRRTRRPRRRIVPGSGCRQTLDDAAVELAHAIYRETDGNPSSSARYCAICPRPAPFTRAPTARGSPGSRWTRWPCVRACAGHRVGSVAGLRRGKVLAVASVIGRDFDLDLLARATTTSEDDVLDILDAAPPPLSSRAQRGAGSHNFSHALIQRTLYEDLGATRRARAHRQAAEALEELCGDEPGARVGELARHWLAATQPIDLTKAIATPGTRVMPRWLPSPLRTRFAITRRPSTLPS